LYQAIKNYRERLFNYNEADIPIWSIKKEIAEIE
jgi:hypothetical protein